MTLAPPPPHPVPMMGSEANRVANARVTGLKNARWSKINKYKGFVKQKQLAKFVEEPKPRRPRPHKPTLSVTTEELHANHVFVLHIYEPELATTLEVAELERAKALGRGAGAKIRDHPSRLDYTVYGPGEYFTFSWKFASTYCKGGNKLIIFV
eukprot:jgi/Chrpa1/19503/Chrysochromulina_OHIO_Genome00008520-RA